MQDIAQAWSGAQAFPKAITMAFITLPFWFCIFGAALETNWQKAHKSFKRIMRRLFKRNQRQIVRVYIK